MILVVLGGRTCMDRFCAAIHRRITKTVRLVTRSLIPSLGADARLSRRYGDDGFNAFGGSNIRYGHYVAGFRSAWLRGPGV